MNRQEVLDYVKNKYGTMPEYLWEKDSTSGVLRHSENTKWYGIVMTVKHSTLGLEGEGVIDILNMKCNIDDINFLHQIEGILPGYHMNKAHWISVLLDGTVDDNLLMDLIDKSYELTLPKKR